MWRGFELHPEVPKGGMAVSALFGEERAAGFEGYLTRFAATFGVPLRISETIPNTRRALAVTELARDQGKLEVFRDAAMDAHWVHGQNIESDEALSRLAESVGMDPKAAVRAAEDPVYLDRLDAQRDEAHGRGVTGIPTFYFGDMKVVGCRSYDDLSRLARSAGIPVRK